MTKTSSLDMLTVRFDELAEKAEKAEELRKKVEVLKQENNLLHEENKRYSLNLEDSVNQALIQQLEENKEHLPSDLRRGELVAYSKGQDTYQETLESTPEYMQDVTSSIKQEYQDIKNWMSELSEEQRNTLVEDPNLFGIAYRRALIDKDILFSEESQEETFQRNLEQVERLNEYRNQKVEERYESLEKGLEGIEDHILTVGYSVEGEDGEIVLPSAQESTLNSLVFPVILESWGEHGIPREAPRRDMVRYDRVSFKTDASLLQHGAFKESYTQALEEIGFNVETKTYIRGGQ